MTETRIITRALIEDILKKIDLMPAIKNAFVSYSKGLAVVPPVGELLFTNPPGETHIKYGYLKDQEYFIIKIASGFPLNHQAGISNSQGVMLLFNQRTGKLVAVLLDDGLLTDIRTVMASIITIQQLAMHPIRNIGLIGSGTQARWHLHYLPQYFPETPIYIWGRNDQQVRALLNQFSHLHLQRADTLSDLVSRCSVLVSMTSAQQPIIKAQWVRPGTHITALGSDTSQKQELEPALLAEASHIIVDSKTQCEKRGEFYQAQKKGLNLQDKVMELGWVIERGGLPNKKEDQISVADLTGVAVQDIAIAQSVYDYFLQHHSS